MPGEPSILLLAVAFFVAALLYSSVGFGGGSSYLALLGLTGFPVPEMAFVALICNIIVVTGGSWHFYRAGHLRLRLLVPFLVTSLPAAFLGGRWRLEVAHLTLVIGISLALAAFALILNVRSKDGLDAGEIPSPKLWGLGAVIGGLMGGLAGVVGIGGGIFLAPLLHGIGWGRVKQIAAAASVFILLNSIAGLAGQLTKIKNPDVVLRYAPLFLGVFVGGQIGSHLGARLLPPVVVKRMTGGVVLLAAIKMLF